MAVYDQLAAVYDLVHRGVAADIPFYLELARRIGGPILELGCGSGRTLLPLAEANFEVVGIDNSEPMLAIARQRVAAGSFRQPVTLCQGEMTAFDLGRVFSLVTVPFHTWMHLPDRETQLAALDCIARHLAPGGRLVVDLPAPATLVEAEHDNALTLEGTFPDPATGDTVLQFSATQIDLEQQVLQVTWIYDRVALNGTVRRLIVPMALRYLYPREARELFAQVGLQIKTFWGDYNQSPYSYETEKLIILAEKPA